jgi:signal transduction histidine kinase
LRWSIRNQIFVPFVAVVLLAVVAMTAVAALLAARQREAQTLAQLQNVVETLAHTSIPFTESVLQKMSGLSGAQFVACDAGGNVIASTLPAGFALPAELDKSTSSGELTSLASQPTYAVDGTRYFLARVQPRGDAAVRALFVLYPESSWSRARWDAALPPLAVGAGAIVLTSVASGWLAQRFGRRIRLLQRQVAAIAAGDFSEITATGRQDEILDLVTSVNSMAAQLRSMQQTIRQSERTRLLGQLAGGLAHQLRNAVTGARMALQLHQRRCPAPAEDKSVSVALRQLALTETQVRGLLSLGRGEQSRSAICDLGQVVADVAALVHPICEHALVSLETPSGLRGDASSGCVRADVESLRAAILNLVTNAIEAAGPGGLVTLQIISGNGMSGVEVKDSGSGPPSQVAETLFEPFVTTKPEGVGLGLSLVRQVAVDHGGTLTWRRDDGQTVFRLMLPTVETAPVKSEIGNSKSEMTHTRGTQPVGLGP